MSVTCINTWHVQECQLHIQILPFAWVTQKHLFHVLSNGFWHKIQANNIIMFVYIPRNSWHLPLCKIDSYWIFELESYLTRKKTPILWFLFDHTKNALWVDVKMDDVQNDWTFKMGKAIDSKLATLKYTILVKLKPFFVLIKVCLFLQFISKTYLVISDVFL